MSVPLSLYVHFPWCVKKCPYCDFNSHQVNGELPEHAYVQALVADLDRDMADYAIEAGTTLTSIFLGGGTPSLFSGGAMAELMAAIRSRFHLDENTEITLEANPGTADINNFEGYRDAGINRISLGVQSFGPTQLSALGRIHTADEATSAFLKAREAGFSNINIDLMHGLPQQDTEGALLDLNRAIELQPEHISWYQLTIEPNTVFYRQTPSLPEDDTLWQIYQQGTERLAQQGYQRYEISAFGQIGQDPHKPNKASRHNLNYWQFGDYLGIGAGAHGKLTQTDNQGMRIIRTNKTRLPSDYLNQQKRKQTQVPTDELLLEFLMNGLRLVAGFDEANFPMRTGQPMGLLETFVQQASAKGLVQKTDHRIHPTELGLQYLNDLLLLAADI